MSILTSWSPFFQSVIRMRGRAYQQEGRVERQEPAEDELVRAEVKGAEPYTVTIRKEGRGAIAECTCPHYEGGAFCKHIWATLVDLTQDDEGPGANAMQLFGLRVQPPKARKRDESEQPSRNREPDWIGRLSLLRPPSYDRDSSPASLLPIQRQVCYVVLPELSTRHNGLVVELRQRTAIATGWSKPKPLKLSPQTIPSLADPIDRELCALIMGATWVTPFDTADSYRVDRSHATFRLPGGARRQLLRRIIETGRAFLDRDEDGRNDPVPLAWSGDQPWVLWLAATEEGEELVVRPELRRDESTLNIATPDLILGGADGVAVWEQQASPFDDRDAFRWVTQFRDEIDGEAKPLRIAASDANRFLDRLYMLPQLPEIDLPAGLGRTERQVEPVPRLDLFSPGTLEDGASGGRNQLAARVWFDYAGQRVGATQPGRFVPVMPPAESGDDEGGADIVPTPAAVAGGAVTDDAAEPELQPLGAAQAGTETVNAEFDADHTLIRRDRVAERDAIGKLSTLGFRQSAASAGDTLTLPVKQMAQAVSVLLGEGWGISADRQAVGSAGPPSLSIASGIDWFELRGTVKYTRADGETEEIGLPQILAAARAGRSMIALGDGSQGLLPEEWLDEHGLLTALGRLEGDHLRFRSSQAAMLDALLDERELVTVDQRFAEARERLRQFDGIKPVTPHECFAGSLRTYQKEGLGWTAFLRWFGMGGILADDMGLGKTIQVLAMLQARKAARDAMADPATNGNGDGHAEQDVHLVPSEHEHMPTLIVVPRSVIFNWFDEASRFTPDLRVMVYTGADRSAMRDEFEHHDIIVTSYGLLRRDIDDLAQFQFDYVVLDEAQAIKNPQSQSAKAARVLQARHRLALTGTPIENHLGDLWSIFEFLNPGMLGSGARFGELVRAASTSRATLNNNGGGNGNGSERAQTVKQIAASLRPFILRRTKKQVLADLPEKTEQTIICQMDDEQRKIYDDLRQYYRGSLMQQLDAAGASGGHSGMGRNAFMVLEALLRLRQAACHPALIDRARDDGPSAKLDALDEMLDDVIDEGAKALVFSQFTSMLSLVRQRFDKAGIKYAYLDGQTRNREEVVRQFQDDEETKVFLISLKAGGVGLNLTAAEYVFILDPWWNPAVEAQAIDRTHRIGQTRPVFAYRMICEDTVEQRIIELQQRKRELADAIVGGEQNLLQNLSREDLERLLS